MTTSAAKVAAAASIALLAAGCGSSQDSSSSSTPTPDATGAPAGSSTASDGSFVAGSYQATGQYQSPAGTQEVQVDMTITADGTVSSVKVVPQASGTSLQFQEKFAGGISDAIVGKKIDELKVEKVSGSSLTSGGFNQAVQQIMDEAKA